MHYLDYNEQIQHRTGDFPLAYYPVALKDQLAAWQAKGHGRIAVITRSQKEAVALSRNLRHASLLTGDTNELEDSGVILSGLNLMKGLEFDAVAVVWPDMPMTDGERRRLYTACSRALHDLTLFRANGSETIQ